MRGIKQIFARGAGGAGATCLREAGAKRGRQWAHREASTPTGLMLPPREKKGVRVGDASLKLS